jgi:hypothetical protein
MQTTEKKAGRPQIPFCQDTANHICELLEQGLTLSNITQLPDIPSIPTIYRWMDENPEFSAAYTRARAKQADTLAERVLDEAFSSHDAQIGRLRMDALKWFASKLAPKRYGDKVEVETNSQQNFKISFSVPERDTLNSLKSIELPSPSPQLIEVTPEAIPEQADSNDSSEIAPDKV